MNKNIYLIIFIFVILIILPVILVKGFFFFFPEEKGEVIILSVYKHKQDKIVKMELSDYLMGVVAAEMPASYSIEALKAQAVAARTYTLKKLPAYGGQGSSEHPGADICTDYHHSQAWLSEKEMKNKWGFLSFFYYWARITEAVEETRDQILIYENKIIDAVYHSNSGGQTEAAKYVWGREVSYLRSIESIYDKEHKDNFHYQYRFDIYDFDQKLGSSIQTVLNNEREKMQSPELVTNETNNEIFKVIKYSESGRVVKIRILDREYTGQEVRKRLDLPSTMFEFSLQQNNIICDGFGNGHGVGLSQDGADGYGDHGYSYKDILKHYYQGVRIGNIFEFQK